MCRFPRNSLRLSAVRIVTEADTKYHNHAMLVSVSTMDLDQTFRVTLCRACSSPAHPHLAHEAGGCLEGLFGGKACACRYEQPDDPFVEQDGVALRRVEATA